MKAKSLNKKLQLNKNLVARLNDFEQNQAKGGACTCRNTGCATYIWQDCGKPTDCACETFLEPECLDTLVNC